jgi:hypothetical protein
MRVIAFLLILAFQLCPIQYGPGLLSGDQPEGREGRASPGFPGGAPRDAGRLRRHHALPGRSTDSPCAARGASSGGGLRRADAPVGSDIGIIRRHPDGGGPCPSPSHGTYREGPSILRGHPAWGGARGLEAPSAETVTRLPSVILRC